MDERKESFLRTLTFEKKYILNLNPPDNQDVFNPYMSGTINGDIEQLSKLIFELLC